jgi:PPM family protein phosphatase
MGSINSYFAESSSGPHLEINEDSLVVDVRNGLFGVIDAYGGSGIGDQVSELVKKVILESYGILSMDEDATLPLYFNANFSIETNALINAIKLAHSKLKSFNNQKDSSSRGGASFLGCTINDNRLQLVGTGNCLAITLRRDETLISYFPHSNSEIKITGRGQSNIYPLSGLGLFDELEFFVQDAKIYRGDRIFFFSSGTYAPFNLTELSILINEFGNNPKLLRKELCKLAEARGHKGNQSIVCLEF